MHVRTHVADACLQEQQLIPMDLAQHAHCFRIFLVAEVLADHHSWVLAIVAWL